jgi:uncharacterized protein
MIPTAGNLETADTAAANVNLVNRRTDPKPSRPVLPDPETYHLFEYRGDKMLFDLRTGVLLELNDFAYGLLSLCRECPDADRLREALARQYPSVCLEEALAAVRSLYAEGLFRQPRRFTRAEMERHIRALWAHHPYRVQLVVAQHCNLRCTYCYMEQNESNERHVLMSEEQAFQAVDHLVQRSGSRRNLQITFFGGEPTLNFDVIKKVVSYCDDQVAPRHNKTFVFELITNGTLLSGEIADFVDAHDFLLFISLDGWKEMHNTQRPACSGADYHEIILQNAKRIDKRYRERRSKCILKVRANLTAAFPDARAVVNYLESQGFHNIGVAGIYDMPSAASPTPGALRAEQLSWMERQGEDLLWRTLQCIREGKRPSPYGMKSLRKAILRLNKRSRILGMICGVGRNTSAVDTDGNIYPCHRYVNKEAYILGNTAEGMNEEKTKGFYRRCMTAAMNQCAKCWVREYCKGGCSWDLARDDGNLCPRPPAMCDGVKRGIEMSLWFRKELRRIAPDRFKAILEAQGVPADPLDSWQWTTAGSGQETLDC